MRKVIGIGETILDIIFRNEQPSAANPGGSVFNSCVSLARLGIPVTFISEMGADHVGRRTMEFMRQNGISTDYIDVYQDFKSPISLAFLNSQSDAEYSFYKTYPEKRLGIDLPKVEKDDIVMLGSYYSVTPALRAKHVELLEAARQVGAIVYYDPNFRMPHKAEAMKLSSYILENMEYATIVRGSKEDFQVLYDMEGADKIYREKVAFYCPNFIHTRGGDEISLRTRLVQKEYPVEQLTPVSTVGAGDSFSAGIIYGLVHEGITADAVGTLDEATWDRIISYGCALAKEVCMSYDNYISQAFAASYQL